MDSTLPSAKPKGPFRNVQKTGVIYVMSEAAKAGYGEAATGWVNLGQGQPETGFFDGGKERLASVDLDIADLEYAPVGGLESLRAAVAAYYNRVYRQGKKSQYSAANVSIAPGGRAALTRAAATIGKVNLGHFLPDYTAYEELLDVFGEFTSIPILLDPKEGYRFSASDLRREIEGRGVSAILLSNPCNPTGKVVAGEDLADWLSVARELTCGMIFDEFYSMYIWDERYRDQGSVSAAQYVEDVNAEQVLLINGLTKNWRYPGLRIAWAVGPESLIDAMNSAGSFLDGGASRPLQKAAVELLKPEVYEAEAKALKREFAAKRELLTKGLRDLGVKFDVLPQGTFYAWGNIENFPADANTGMTFFRKALAEKIITVPGEFFDVDPGHRRSGRPSRFRHYVRFSFGAPRQSLELGLERMAKLLG